ncbi:hypothetical protein JOQ06_025213, partial [Pogonophryne albipinna]
LTTVPFSCPIMEATWTWSLRWQSRKMNWRDFRRKEGGGRNTALFFEHICPSEFTPA